MFTALCPRRSPQRPAIRRVLAVATALAVALTTTIAGASTAAAATDPAPNTVTAHGSAVDYGPADTLDVSGFVSIAVTPSGKGYWVAGADGGVFSFGDARFHGSAAHLPLASPIVGIAATPTGNGYWLAGADGGVFTFGDASFHGAAASLPLQAPIVGIAATPSGNGYWLAADDGGVFTYGDAVFRGSMGAIPLAASIVGIAPTVTGSGYWLAGADGGVFTFGDASFRGSASGNSDILTTAIAADPDGFGYWLLRTDGHVDAFSAAVIGDDEVPGDDLWPQRPAVAIGAATGNSYWIVHGLPQRLQVGTECGAVRCVEEFLERLGYWPGVIDIVYDDATEQAVMAFQKVHGLTVDGIVDAETLAAIETAERAQAISTSGDVIEVDLDLGVVYAVEDGRTLWVFNAAVGAASTPTAINNGKVLARFDGTIIDLTGDVGHRPLFFRSTGWSIHGVDDPPGPGATSDGDVVISLEAMNIIWDEGLASTNTTVWIHR